VVGFRDCGSIRSEERSRWESNIEVLSYGFVGCWHCEWERSKMEEFLVGGEFDQ